MDYTIQKTLIFQKNPQKFQTNICRHIFLDYDVSVNIGQEDMIYISYDTLIDC